MSTAARPLSPLHQPLRRAGAASWVIEDDAISELALEALEVLGLITAELLLHRISRVNLVAGDDDLDLALRAMGTVAGRVGMSRLTWLTGVDELGRPRRDSAGSEDAAAVGLRLRAILQWLFSWGPDPDQPPQLRPTTPPPADVRVYLDDLWAALIHLDRRATAQGLPGPGRRRSIIRTTTRRSR